VRSLPTAAGRWSPSAAPRADAIDADASARQLLARYGVVFRDLVVREPALPPGARVGDDLTYHEAPRRAAPAAQPSLPL
jgi:hypothetical protein